MLAAVAASVGALVGPVSGDARIIHSGSVDAVNAQAVSRPLDILIAIDTTGSMQDAIDQALADASQLVSNVRSRYPGAQFGLAQFKDSGDDPEYELVQPLTADASRIESGLGTLSADGGDDDPEAYNVVFDKALSRDVGWLPKSRRLLVVVGDAEPHGAGTASFSGECLLRDCRGMLAAVEKGDYPALAKRLPGIYAAVRDAAPNAEVFVVGYPRLFPRKQSDTTHCGWLEPHERETLNRLGKKLNDMEQKAAEAAGLEFVPVQDALEGHELCTKDSWMFKIAHSCAGDSKCGHPLKPGQQAIAKIVATAIQSPRVLMRTQADRWLLTVDASGENFRAGPWRARRLAADASATPATLIAAFGRPTTCNAKTWLATWQSIGLRAHFDALSAPPAGVGVCDGTTWPSISRMDFLNKRWHTLKGLSVNDSLARLRSLYPQARNVSGVWRLQRRFNACCNSYSDALSAVVRAGRVTTLQFNVQGQGE